MIEIPDFQQADVFEDPLHVDELPAWGRMGKRGCALQPVLKRINNSLFSNSNSVYYWF